MFVIHNFTPGYYLHKSASYNGRASVQIFIPVMSAGFRLRGGRGYVSLPEMKMPMFCYWGKQGQLNISKLIFTSFNNVVDVRNCILSLEYCNLLEHSTQCPRTPEALCQHALGSSLFLSCVTEDVETRSLPSRQDIMASAALILINFGIRH